MTPLPVQNGVTPGLSQAWTVFVGETLPVCVSLCVPPVPLRWRRGSAARFQPPSELCLVACSRVERGWLQLEGQGGKSKHDNIPSEGNYSQQATATA